jgi:peptidoglycan hydrolase-like protein with peptidoglycan-binding domain
MAEAGSDPTAVREREFWRQTEVQDRRADYQAYLERYPNGIWQPEATARLAELAAVEAMPPLPEPTAAEAALGMTRTDRLSIEQRLAFLGFAPGPQDGSFDDETRWAIESYQRSRGQSATGYLDRQTVAAVMRETRDARTGIVAGADALINILRDLGQ